MPKKFTEKKINKKITAPIHPRSRKAGQITRARLRRDRIDATKAVVSDRKSALVLRLSWFHEILKNDEQKAPTLEETNEWIKMYIDRFDEEIEKQKAQQRPGRPIPLKLDELRIAKQQELEEFKGAGFELAEVDNDSSFKRFMEWDGTYGSLHLVKLVRYKMLQEFRDEMEC